MNNFGLPEIQVPQDMSHDDMPDLLRHWYLGPVARRHMMLRRFAEVDRELPAHGRILDVGCAWGFNPMALALRGYDVTAMDLVVDPFPAGQRIARHNDIGFRAIGADAAALPFAHNTFDGISMVETFEHIYIDDRPRALLECARVLRPGGLIVLSTPNYASLVERAKRFTGNHRWLRQRLPTMCYPEEGIPRDGYHPYRYHHPLPDEAIAGLLRGAGFEVLRSKHFLFMLKSTGRPAYPVMRVVERVLERIPGVGRLAATVCFVARKPAHPGIL